MLLYAEIAVIIQSVHIFDLSFFVPTATPEIDQVSIVTIQM
jgi:hypothetical protein